MCLNDFHLTKPISREGLPLSRGMDGWAESQPSQDAIQVDPQEPAVVEHDDLVFYFMGDWGELQSMKYTVEAMNNWAERNRKPDFLLALGDNFYPSGVKSVDDPKWAKWEKTFLSHPNLRVPWRPILGNHDYQSNPQAQIDFTKSPKNPDGIWQLPGRNYQFTHALPNGRSVEFFGIDTNGCQGHVRRQWPNSEHDLHNYKPILRELLNNSTATWKIVFAHHPLYTKGKEHGTLGRCLRSDTYSHRGGSSRGYGLEQLLSECGVSAYISGHEHMMEHHFAEGIHHFVCGATGMAAGWYGGEDTEQKIDWFSARVGFGLCTVKDDVLQVKFVSSKNGAEYYTVAIPVPAPKPAAPEEQEVPIQTEENPEQVPAPAEQTSVPAESKETLAEQTPASAETQVPANPEEIPSAQKTEENNLDTEEPMVVEDAASADPALAGEEPPTPIVEGGLCNTV